MKIPEDRPHRTFDDTSGADDPASSAGFRDEISLLDLAAVLLRERRTILVATVLVPFLIVAVTLILPRTWTADTSFMPQITTDAARSRLTSLAGQFGVDIGSAEPGQTPEFYADLVRSREILEQVARDTFVVDDSRWLFGRGISRGTLASILELDFESEPLRVDRARHWLRNDALTVTTSATTGVVEVRVTTPWPNLSEEIAARIVELVNQFNLETRQSQAADERAFIEARMASAEAELRTAENALQQFLQDNRAFRNSPELVFEHDRLQRQVAMRQQIYTSLGQSYEQARITEVRNTPVITVIERAKMPVLPDSRMLLMKGVLGVLLGSTIGIFLAIIKDYGRRKREEDPVDYEEVNRLWREAKADLKLFGRRKSSE